jgi:Fe-S-cluster-containing dehydrogenase component
MEESPKGEIIVNKQVCTGCRTCEIICSLVKERYINPELSRIQVLRNPMKGPDFTITLLEECDLCEGDPKCVEYCAMGALTLKTEDDDPKAEYLTLEAK